MQPYVIRQGDYLAKLAHRYGFDANSVWNDPANAKLRDERPNPNILFPGDLLLIPEPAALPQHSLTTGTTNTFTSGAAPTTSITLKFLDKDLASQAITIQELPDLTGLSTSTDGSVSFDAPVSADVVTVVFTSSGATHECRIGYIDPIDTLSGVFCRLQNLGYLALDTTLDGTDIESVREALRAFNADRGAGCSSAPPSSESPPPSSSPSSAPDSDATADDGGPWPYGCTRPETDDESAGGDAASPPSALAPEIDNAGLADDGTLDASTGEALVQAHGS